MYSPLYLCDFYFPLNYTIILISFGHIIGPETSWKTVVVPIGIVAGSVVLLCGACIVIYRLLNSRRNPPQEVTPLISEEGGHRGSEIRHNTSGVLSQAEETSSFDNNEDFVTAT